MFKDMKINIPQNVQFIIDSLEKNGYEAYIVGGCVRDSLLGSIPNDWDITTNAKWKKVKEIFDPLGIKVIETGVKHGTVTLIIEYEKYEVTTYRIDGEYFDGRHPNEVQFVGDLKQDLNRRDFTINAMAYNLKNGLIDYFNGCEDLENKIIRSVGEPEKRFCEDALRMIRAIRFSAKLDFSIEDNTEEGILKLRKNIKLISMERIRDEFNKILTLDNPYKTHLLWDYGIMEYFLPEYKCIKDLRKEVFKNLIKVGKDLLLRISVILIYIRKNSYITVSQCKEILKRMRYDKVTINRIIIILEYSDFKISSCKDVRMLLGIMGIEMFNDLLKVKKSFLELQKNSSKEILNIEYIKQKSEEILFKNQCVNLRGLNINGKDLKSIGISQGKKIGDVLKFLLSKVLEKPELNNKKILIRLADDYINKK